MLELQENIYTVHKSRKPTTCRPASPANYVVGLGDLSTDVFLEVQNKRYS